MVESFKDKETGKVRNETYSKRFPEDIQRIGLRKLILIHRAKDIHDSRVPTHYCWSIKENPVYNGRMNNDHETGLPAQMPGDRLSENRYPMVPFSIDLGTSTVQGILSIHNNSLRLQWRVYNLLDAPKGSMQSFDLPFERIEELDLKHRIIGSRLTLVCRNAEDLGDFPLPAGSINEFKCSVKRKYRSLVDLWAAEVLMRLAEQS